MSIKMLLLNMISIINPFLAKNKIKSYNGYIQMVSLN